MVRTKRTERVPTEPRRKKKTYSKHTPNLNHGGTGFEGFNYAGEACGNFRKPAYYFHRISFFGFVKDARRTCLFCCCFDMRQYIERKGGGGPVHPVGRHFSDSKKQGTRERHASIITRQDRCLSSQSSIATYFVNRAAAAAAAALQLIVLSLRDQHVSSSNND